METKTKTDMMLSIGNQLTLIQFKTNPSIILLP